MQAKFETLFPWYWGSEAQFLEIMNILVELPNNRGWKGEFHRFRMLSEVLHYGVKERTVEFVYNTVVDARNKVYGPGLWFTWDESAYDKKLCNPPSVMELEFLSAMTSAEREYATSDFATLWSHCRKSQF
jgi:hypothetical protein